MAPRWDERVARIVRLARAGVMVLVDHAWDARLPELLRALRGDSSVIVCTEPDELFDLADGSTVVFVPLAEHAAALNAGRPRVAQRALKVVLWADRKVTVALARRAPDFFDWISHRVECPDGIPPHVVAGIETAERARVRGVVCSGLGALDDDGCIETMAEAGWAILEWPDRISESPLDALWFAARERRVWVEGVQTGQDLIDLRVALAAVGSDALVVANTQAAMTPGWWRLDASVLGIREAARRLPRLPAGVVAMFGGEEASIDLANRLLDAGEAPDRLALVVRDSADSGAALACAAFRRRVVSAEEVALGRGSAPLLRGLTGHRDVGRAARQIERRCREQLARGELPRAEELGWCLARRAKMTVLPVDRVTEFPLECVPFVIEAFERHAAQKEAPPARLVQAAEGALGESLFLDMVERWGRRVANEDPRHLLFATRSQEETGMLIAARAGYIALLGMSPTSLDLHFPAALGLARVDRLLGRYEHAVSVCEDYLGHPALLPTDHIELISEAIRSSLLLEDRDTTRSLRRTLLSTSTRSKASIRRVGRRHLRRVDAIIAITAGEHKEALVLLGAEPDVADDVEWFVLRAKALQRIGRFDEAIECCNEARSISREKSYPRSEVELACADILNDRGDVEDAISHARAALENFERMTGANSHTSARCRRLLAACYTRCGDVTSAEGELRKAEWILRRILPSDHSEALDVALALAALPGRVVPPGPLREFDALRRRLGDHHPTVRYWQRVLDNRARAVRAAGA
jgi:tetratricopeptide (TPR) repeat protein